jgi:hypothetical protein
VQSFRFRLRRVRCPTTTLRFRRYREDVRGLKFWLGGRFAHSRLGEDRSQYRARSALAHLERDDVTIMLVLAIVLAVVVASFIGLWRWALRTERDDVDWEHGSQTDAEGKQAVQLGIALNVNGTFSR